MTLFDDLIARCGHMFRDLPCKRYPYDGAALWEQETQQSILFRKDTAYELGGGSLGAYSAVAFTSDESVADEVIVCGPDLPQIKADTSYAVFTTLRVDDGAWADREQAYRVLRRLDYTRYHVYPRGYMTRISPSAHREPVRVSREALRLGLDFEQVGRCYIAAYHAHPEVLSARIVYITDPRFSYEAFGEAARRIDAVTESLNEIFSNLIMDCASCRLKPLCDEVEGLRKLHFETVR